MDAQTVLEQVAELLAHRPFTADEVSSALGVDLDKQASSTRYFDVYRSTSPTAAFSTVEVRQPTPESKGKGGMLLLDWSGECVTREQVGDRFGATEPGPPWMPRPPQPADSPRYDTHPQDWGEVRLGYDPDSGCLEKIVADANG